MIIQQHKHIYEKLRDYYRSPMLMLGAQECQFGDPREFFGVDSYSTIDLNGKATITRDLAGDLKDLRGQFGTVFNLGTLEHVWDLHRGFCNTAQAVQLNGYYINASPAEGYAGHGMHVIDPKYIKKFFALNGFKILDSWIENDEGINKMRGLHLISWSVYKKLSDVDTFQSPTQISD